MLMCFRSATVVRGRREPLAQLGHQGVLAGGRQPAALSHARARHVRHGQGELPGPHAALHG